MRATPRQSCSTLKRFEDMTEEQYTTIGKHFDELHISASGFGLNISDAIRDALKASYLAGADYALDIYLPHWISVEDYATDELPPLIDEKDPYGESVHVLFVVELDGIQFISKGCFDYDSGMWHALETDCSYCKENVTHWQRLPAPPKKGD